MKKALTTVAAALLLATPVNASNEADYQSCLKLRAELNAVQAGLGDKSTDCNRVRTWKNPQERVNAAGGRTALIRKCEAIWKPQLKDQGSYRYKDANIAVTEEKLNVTVNYTATNSFGGRVPGQFTCGFGG